MPKKPRVQEQRYNGDRHVLDRLTPTVFAALAGAAALAVFGVAFAAGRVTAPSTKPSPPARRALRATGAPLSLPHLSQAVPLAALRPAPAPVVQRAPALPKPQIRRKKPARTGAPVDITGSG